MGFTLKIEGNESLFYGENIVQMVTASLDTPKEGRTISIIMPAEDVNITSKLSEMMTDFVESGIAAATEAQNAKAENVAGSSTMPGMYQGAQVISDK
ncbi:hypothetical protein [Megamonas funiformis]|uniref:hypothetical protein n=1 Tax=Megamonas funiformis TaxID=437897 RepID=UPI0022E01B90|nr:hypothetical protein [Megamonas funiformis]